MLDLTVRFAVLLMMAVTVVEDSAQVDVQGQRVDMQEEISVTRMHLTPTEVRNRKCAMK